MYDYLVTAFSPNVHPYARMVREQSPRLAADKWFRESQYDEASVPKGLILSVTEVYPGHTESDLEVIQARVTHAFQVMTRVELAPMELPF